MCDLGYYPLERGGGRYTRRRFLFAGVPGSRDSSASPPPILRVVSSSHTPNSLPNLISDGALGDLVSDVESPLRSSSPPKRGAGSSSKSRRPSPYAWQTCVPRDPAQRLRMQTKSLLHRQVEESEDPFLVMAIWKSVLGQEQALWDHDVLGCRDCVCHPVTMKWSYCSSSRYHPVHPLHLCLSEDCCGLEDWSN